MWKTLHTQHFIFITRNMQKRALINLIVFGSLIHRLVKSDHGYNVRMSAVYTQRAFNFGLRAKNSLFVQNYLFLWYLVHWNWMTLIYRSVKNQFESNASYCRSALIRPMFISAIWWYRNWRFCFWILNICTFSFNYFHVKYLKTWNACHPYSSCYTLSLSPH